MDDVAAAGKMNAMADGAALKALLAPDVAAIEKAMEADVAAMAGESAILLSDILRYGLFNGGKRIRPLLAVLSYRLAGGGTRDGGADDPGDIRCLAIAFEYLHCATLFHDDVIDRASTRRGRPAVNVTFGETAAILAGDYLHARSMLLIGRLGGVQALEIFCGATTAMVDGEFRQLYNAGQFNPAEGDYFAVIMGKTARLIGAACEIGALAAGAGAEIQMALRNYGLHLGCAFQIIDDLLDYQGEAAMTGKAVGNDFAEGKMTLPLIIAINRADQPDRQRLLAMLASADERKDGFAEARALIERHDGFGLARKKAEAMTAEALAQLRLVDTGQGRPERAVLEALAAYVLQRRK